MAAGERYFIKKQRSGDCGCSDGNVRSSSVSWEKKSLWQPCAPGMAWKRCAPDGVKRLLGQREPVKRSLYRQPICILSYSLAEKFVDQTKDRIRFVPYRALGAEDGLLAVMDVDEMILQDGRQMRRYEHMAVGIAQKGLLEDKEYDLILHASLG